MKTATKTALLTLAAPAALLGFQPAASPPARPAPSAQAVEQAVALAQAQVEQPRSH